MPRRDPLPTPPRFDNWKPKRQRRWIANNADPGLTRTPPGPAQTTPQPGANFPMPQKPAADFLPMTPQFEAGRRGVDDEYSSAMMGLINQRDLIQPTVNLSLARMATDQGYANSSLDESLTERGMFHSGTNPYLRNRDIDIPYGRQRQDLATNAAAAYGDIASQMSQAGLGYSQGLHELMLNRAADATATMPMNVPQYGPQGPRQAQTPQTENKGKKPPRRQGRNRNRNNNRNDRRN